MKTIKEFNFRGTKIEVITEKKHSRDTVITAVKLLKQIKSVSKFGKQPNTIEAFRHGREFIKQLKQIVKNSPTTSVTLTFPVLNRSLRGYLVKSAQYSTWLEKHTINSSQKTVIKDAHELIKKRIRSIKNQRNKIREIEPNEITLFNRSGTYQINAQMIVASSNFNRDTRNYYSQSRTIRVFTPNSLRNAIEARRAHLVFLGKSPKTDERHISVEIEFGSKKNRSELGAALFSAGVADYVELKSDGSVRELGSEYHPHEIAVCVPVSKRDKVITSVLKVLNESGAKVNKTCGLHVHLDMRGYDHTKAFSNLVSAQTILYQMIPVSRRDNNYCKKTVNKSFAYHRNSSNRYQGINPCSFRKYRTIEVRLHSGTTDFTKITNFMDILSAVAYNETKIVRAASTVSGFVKQHKLSEQIKQYIDSRIRLFNNIIQEEVA